MQPEGRKAFEIPPPPPGSPDPKWSPPKKRKVWPWVLGAIVALAIIGSLVGDDSTTSESERAASEDRIAEALGEEPTVDDPVMTQADTFLALLATEGLDYVFADSTDAQIDSMGFNGCEVIRKGVEGGLGFKASTGIVVLTLQESLAEYNLSLPEAQHIMVSTVGAYCPEILD